MGFFDIFKRKPTDLRPTRNMEMKFLYECPQCSKEKAMRFKVSLVEDYKQIYIQWVGQSNSPTLVKLPLVDMKVDKQNNYIVAKLHDRLDNGTMGALSNERWKEIGFLIKCPYCKVETPFFLSVCITHNADGSLNLQETNSKGVYSFPIALLKRVGQGDLKIVTFLNPVSESDEATEMATSEIHEDKLKRLVDDENLIVHERIAEIYAESNAAIQSNFNDVEAYYKRALAYVLENEYESAFKDLSKAIELDRDYTPAITKRGLIYVIKKEYNLAMKDYNRAIELDSGYSPAYLNRGICHYEMGHTDLALNDLNKVLEMSSDPVLIKQAKQYSIMCQKVNNLHECDKARAYIKNGKNDQAITNLIKVTEANPSNASAYFYLGMAYDNQEEYDQAISALNKAIQLDPELLGAHNNRGWVYLKKKLYWSAIPDFTEEIRLDPGLVPVYLNRGNAYYNTGQPRLAIADLNRALELSSDPEQMEKIKRQIAAIS